MEEHNAHHQGSTGMSPQAKAARIAQHDLMMDAMFDETFSIDAPQAVGNAASSRDLPIVRPTPGAVLPTPVAAQPPGVPEFEFPPHVVAMMERIMGKAVETASLTAASVSARYATSMMDHFQTSRQDMLRSFQASSEAVALDTRTAVTTLALAPPVVVAAPPPGLPDPMCSKTTDDIMKEIGKQIDTGLAKELGKVAKSFTSDFDKCTSRLNTSTRHQEQITLLSTGKIPNMMKGFRLGKPPVFVHEIFNKDEEMVFKVTIPKGSSFRKAKEILHMEHLAIGARIDKSMADAEAVELKKVCNLEALVARFVKSANTYNKELTDCNLGAPAGLFPTQLALVQTAATQLYREKIVKEKVKIDAAASEKDKVKKNTFNLAKAAAQAPPKKILAAEVRQLMQIDSIAARPSHVNEPVSDSMPKRKKPYIDYLAMRDDPMGEDLNLEQRTKHFEKFIVHPEDIPDKVSKRKWNKKQLAERKNRPKNEQSPNGGSGKTHQESKGDGKGKNGKGKGKSGPKGAGKGKGKNKDGHPNDKGGKGKSKGKGKGKGKKGGKGWK